MSKSPVKITTLTAEQIAKLISGSVNTKITAEIVREIAEIADIVKADGTISLIDFTAYLAKEVVSGN
ncbi:MAG: hypothetical protein JEZ07_08880 [Phycisphaerae bacterium]|nr:hypothetical protein [Phycisphaerae bacterium]